MVSRPSCTPATQVVRKIYGLAKNSSRSDNITSSDLALKNRFQVLQNLYTDDECLKTEYANAECSLPVYYVDPSGLCRHKELP